jgi:hypothetical protein
MEFGPKLDEAGPIPEKVTLVIGDVRVVYLGSGGGNPLPQNGFFYFI